MTLSESVPASSYLGPPPSPPVPFATFVPAYGLFNAIATVEIDSMGLELSVWGRNLGDEEYYNFVGDFAFAAYGNPGAPRTYGVTARLDF
jgi:outer membrane receptor protein involved in Fe transport